eukprot:17114-Heterococcus_DN1.PRE.1
MLRMRQQKQANKLPAQHDHFRNDYNANTIAALCNCCIGLSVSLTRCCGYKHNACYHKGPHACTTTQFALHLTGQRGVGPETAHPEQLIAQQQLKTMRNRNMSRS